MNLLWLGLLTLAGTQEPKTCDDCHEETWSTKLCAPHQEEEDAAFAEWGEKLTSEDLKDRVMARGMIAKLTYEHVNAPTRRVAQAVVTGLREPVMYRGFAILMLREQHPDVAVPALVLELETTLDAFEKLRVVWMETKIPFHVREKCKECKKRGEPASIHGLDLEVAPFVPQNLRLLLRELGSFPDRRSVAALRALLERDFEDQTKKNAETACMLLIGFGDAESLQAVVDYQTRLYKAVRKGPIGWEDQQAAAVYFGYEFQAKIYSKELDVPWPDAETLAKNYDLLEERLRELGFTELPKRDNKDYLMARNWRTWLKKNAEQLPQEPQATEWFKRIKLAEERVPEQEG